ncbi:MAG: hypothetical protein J7507_13200 [Pseudoxanthomonas sp.]|nr:hypothetical protein [Pseudoxanthomonas sp.]
MNAAEFPPGPATGRAIGMRHRLRPEYPSPTRLRRREPARRFQLRVPAVPAVAFTEPDGGAVR